MECEKDKRCGKWMLGSFRFILALLVVTQHLLLIPSVGHFAVHGFFILSGFLMTLVMSDTYGYTLIVVYIITIALSITFGLFCRYSVDLPIGKLRNKIKSNIVIYN